MTADIKHFKQAGLSWAESGPSEDSACTLVFIGGYGCNRHVWRHQMAALGEHTRCIAVDLPGHGASDPDVGKSSIIGCGEVVNQLCQDLNLERPVLVGHSMGGRVSLEAVRQNPGPWAGVLLLDVSRAVSPDHDTSDQQRLRSGESHKAFRAHMRAMFEDNFSATCPQEIRDEIRASSKALDHACANALTPTIGKWDHEHWEEALDALNCPLLVLQSTYLIYGQSRRILEPGETTPFFDMVRARIPSVEIDMIRTGHFSMLEEPQRVTSALLNFVKRL